MTGVFSPAETNVIWNALTQKSPLERIDRRHPRKMVKVMRDVRWMQTFFSTYQAVHGPRPDLLLMIQQRNPKRFKRVMESLTWLDKQLVKRGAGGLFG